MQNRDDTERRLRELSEAARRADRQEAPGFEDVLARPERDRRWWKIPGFGLRLATVSAAGCLTVAISAAWYLADRPVPEQVSEAELPPEPELAEMLEPVAEVPDVAIGFANLSAVEQTVELLEVSEPFAVEAPESFPAPPEPKPKPNPKPESAPVQVPQPAVEQAAPEPVERVKMMNEAEIARLNALGYTGGLLDSSTQDLPAPGRYYQSVLTMKPGHADDGDGNPTVHGSRQRDFKAVLGGVSNVNPNSIEEFEPEPVFNTESYDMIRENEFLASMDNPLSTFSIDVDTASYSNVRRMLREGREVPRDAVRIEEMINYFDYDYPAPKGPEPFSSDVEIADCPWNPEHRLVRIGIKGKTVDRSELNGSNLVFLIDVSGSMRPENKLPLLKRAFRLLIDKLDGDDRVAMVVYAGASGLVLPSTPGSDKSAIRTALRQLDAGGSTNGGSGLQLAYKVARENFIRGGVNRVILATDGDFNVGTTDRASLFKLIEQDAKDGIFLTALGFGMGNYKDGTLEMLADKGNGNYAYIDTLREARKVLVEEMTATLVTIAKDVKIQVEFNPKEVGAYRLIGYENRMLNKEDFNDDKKDAGEIGAGHTVTALYEIVPPGKAVAAGTVDPLKYRKPAATSEQAKSGEMLTLKIRYKEPDGDTSSLLEFPVVDTGLSLDRASVDFRFAAAVAEFGMILRDSKFRGSASLDHARDLVLESIGDDPYGYRAEFIDLIGLAGRK